MEPPLVVAVTVTYNAGEDLAPFLASFAAQTLTARRLIIIDNGSSDGTVGRLQALSDPGIEVILNGENRGVAAANNQGIARARQLGAASVLLLNNDTVFGADLLAGLAAGLSFPRVAAISPLIPFYAEPDRIWYGGGRFLRWPGILNVHEHAGEPLSAVGKQPFQTSYAPTCCLLIDARVFDSIGTMDERYFVYWDDTDFVWRMGKAGLGLAVDPRLTLLHKVSRSTGGALSPFTIRYAQRNQMLFVRKHFPAFWVGWTAFASVGLAGFNLLRRRTNLGQTGLRLRALLEGLSMPLATDGRK